MRNLKINSMKKVLGLDLGTSSIGWAIIQADDNNNPAKIIDMGVRLIPLTTDDATQFSTGNTISKNQDRTNSRTARKGYDRYQQRRENLTGVLKALYMLPDENLIKLPVLQLWELRARAATPGEKLSLPEIGRVLYHLNQKRGYKPVKNDESGKDKKQSEYLKHIASRYDTIKQLDLTIGQYFYSRLKETAVTHENGTFYTYRIKDQIFPREAYMEEYDRIMSCQQKYYPDLLTEKVINKIRNEIIYYQRKLKSCKHLISLCEFEKKSYLNNAGKAIYNGPKVAPKSSPLFQVCKIWESINNLTLKNKKGETFEITLQQKQMLFDYLDNNEKLTLKELYRILEISKADGWWGGKAIGRGLLGNTTKTALKKILKEYPLSDRMLRFRLDEKDSGMVDTETGEIIPVISADMEKEPLYRLWHIVYSINDKDELASALKKQFDITDEEIISNLYKTDFVTPGFGNKSAKAIRRILPFLMQGYMYSEACQMAGFRHSESLTKEENENRELSLKLEPIQKNELRQPIVEKILNQMIKVVNAITDRYGRMDEIRVELARELKQSREERARTDKNMREQEKNNKRIADRIKEYGSPSLNRIQKYRLWEEAQQKCFYCGQPVNVREFLDGFDVEIEHILPRSRFFDNSFNNKVCSCRKCNREKNNRTAYDYMKSKPEEEFNSYIQRIELYYNEGKITSTKRERLLTTEADIPQDFIERQLRETQYISRKAKDILTRICRNVSTPSGSITDFVKHVWGWDTVLHDFHFPVYKEMGMTELYKNPDSGQGPREKIIGWNKRMDHRHHAIDALTIACTRQSFIQRINHLNAQSKQETGDSNISDIKDKPVNLEKWILSHTHFSKQEVKNHAAAICISFKAGKKGATVGKQIKYINGKRKICQTGVIIPKGALHQESVYGRINLTEKDPATGKSSVKEEIVIKYKLGVGNGFLFSGKETYSSKKVFNKKTGEIQKKTDDKIANVLNSIVDKRARKVILNRLNEGFAERSDYTCDVKKALANLKDVDTRPVFIDPYKTIPVKSVRCKAGLSAVIPLRYNTAHEPISFVKPANNHHVALYTDEQGKLHEHVVTFWHAVERKRHKIPMIIIQPREVWNSIQEQEDLPEAFLSLLPLPDWNFQTSLQQNDMFVLNMDETLFRDAIEAENSAVLNPYIYRVQKLASGDYYFRQQYETSVEDEYNGVKNVALSSRLGKVIRTGETNFWKKMNPHKIKIDILGKISSYD